MTERQQEPNLSARPELGRHEILAGSDVALHLMIEVDGQWQDTGYPIPGTVTYSRTSPSEGEEAGFLFMPSEALSANEDGLYPTICPRFVPFGSFKKEFEDGSIARLRFAAYKKC